MTLQNGMIPNLCRWKPDLEEQISPSLQHLFLLISYTRDANNTVIQHSPLYNILEANMVVI